MPLRDRLQIFESKNAAPLASKLFEESFGAPFPVPREEGALSISTPLGAWHQYVATYAWPDSCFETVGFCNWIKFDDVYLEGGMCVRANFYRRLQKGDFIECRALGGVAQMMMATAATQLVDCTAWFGYCGDAKAMAVDLRAGYERTEHPNLIVKWFAQLSDEAQRDLIASVSRIGPF
ncbi:MAG: hypothetical protein ABIQ72_06900 [Usitatibacter sp.]